MVLVHGIVGKGGWIKRVSRATGSYGWEIDAGAGLRVRVCARESEILEDTRESMCV